MYTLTRAQVDRFILFLEESELSEPRGNYARGNVATEINSERKLRGSFNRVKRRITVKRERERETDRQRDFQFRHRVEIRAEVVVVGIELGDSGMLRTTRHEGGGG